jgi:hypothetical protein
MRHTNMYSSPGLNISPASFDLRSSLNRYRGLFHGLKWPEREAKCCPMSSVRLRLCEALASSHSSPS